jgi:hypothetical protein
MAQITPALLRERKAELEKAREERWAELNQILGALSAVDGLLAECETAADAAVVSEEQKE